MRIHASKLIFKITTSFCLDGVNQYLLKYFVKILIRNCQMLSMLLNRLGIRNVMLHSLVPQRARMSSLHAFRDSRIRVLVTTNVASRGLDIPSVSLVINYQVPLDPDEYIHRVGRTARKQGQVGFAITLIVPRVNSGKQSKKMRLKNDINRLKNIESRIGVQLQEYDVNGKSLFYFFLSDIVNILKLLF